MGHWVRIAAAADVAPQEPVPLTVNGDTVALYQIADRYYAVGDLCPHQGCSLSQGEVLVEERQVVCPCHESAFDLTTGAVTQPPATKDVVAYQVRRNGNAIELLVLPADG